MYTINKRSSTTTTSSTSTSSSQSVMRTTSTLLLLASSFVGVANGNKIGYDVCACSPSAYEFTLNFDLGCPKSNITITDNIPGLIDCQIQDFNSLHPSDLVPVEVNTVEIIELGQDYRVLVEEKIEGELGHGDAFTYNSITNAVGSVQNPRDIPKAIRVKLTGVNEFDETITNAYIIGFSNDCRARTFPVHGPGKNAGWTMFTKLGEPRHELCPPLDVLHDRVPASVPHHIASPTNATPKRLRAPESNGNSNNNDNNSGSLSEPKVSVPPVAGSMLGVHTGLSV